MKNSAIGEAPGRLDFMGGVADYSGSLVLETPIRATTRVTVRTLSSPTVQITSPNFPPCMVDVEPLRVALQAKASDAKLRNLLDTQGVPHWARYVAGSLLVFCSATRWLPAHGLGFTVASCVPQSSGVSSSAAIEVATLRALEALSGIHLKGTQLAHLGQRAENHLVGAPCGLMDQLTVQHGKYGWLLPILCRPDRLGDLVKLPRGVIVVGWPSGIKHAVSALPYATARTAAFMGKKILETHLKRRWRYTAEIPPLLLYRQSSLLPERMSGKDFLARYRAVDDSLSEIVPSRRYPVRAAVRFPIEENLRCAIAESLLRQPQGNVFEQVGELMLQSHNGYSAMGLGCPETDKMVDALMKIGPRRGIYGARVSGGGSGGTVVVLLASCAMPALRRLGGRIHVSKDGPLPLIV